MALDGNVFELGHIFLSINSECNRSNSKLVLCKYIYISLKILPNVLIFAGIEFIFFMVASMVLCFGFVQEAAENSESFSYH